MDLPVMPPVAPMLAKLTRDLPVGQYLYEPKWDGFRCIVFRDGDEVELGSRNERPLTRYFPDVVEAVRRELPERCVVDGEIVIAGEQGLDFEALQQRIHPADSRVRMLAASTPASFVAFDLLALDSADLRTQGFEARREALVAALEPGRGDTEAVHLTPATRDVAVAADWFRRFEGAGLDGVVAKAVDLPYREDQRVMLKVKHERTAEFVVGGFRWYKGGEGVGSLMLGLYNGDDLHHVGVIGAFPRDQRKSLVGVLEPYRSGVGDDHPWGQWSEWMVANGEPGEGGTRSPGGMNRWNANKDMSFELVRPELVVEAAYEHLQGNRLRHTARFRRWRPDRDPKSCTYEQMETAVPMELSEIFSLPS
ncbi:MAG TPA: ATP-dependent DNA ligase [Acidimicrobiales bacterium]|nr:ATP-dependent DNA ligase [Acidimicrobiales bacterium]